VCELPLTLDASGHVRVVVNSLRSPESPGNYLTIGSSITQVNAKVDRRALHASSTAHLRYLAFLFRAIINLLARVAGSSFGDASTPRTLPQRQRRWR
jgi:hypothetical protein